MSGKVDYFEHRLDGLQIDSDRVRLGQREIITLQRLIKSYQEHGYIKRAQSVSGDKFLENKFVLDVGCGDKYIQPICEELGAIYRGLDIVDCDFETDALPVKSDSVDVIASLALIEHLYDPVPHLKECLRVLKSGGFLWLSTPDIDATGTSFWNDPTHVHPYNRKSLKQVLQISGFSCSLITPNYRCKSVEEYRDTYKTFFRSRYLLPFAGTSSMWCIPEWLKGKCTGLFALAQKPETKTDRVENND